MGKRSNDAGQESREVYEARMAREEREGGGGDGGASGFQRASKSQLQSRRIVRSSKKWKGAKPTTAIRPPSAVMAAAGVGGASLNPFAKTVLSTGAATGAAVVATTPKSNNPFASVSFASSTKPTPAAPAPRFAIPTPSFSFKPKIASTATTSSSVASSIAPTPKSASALTSKLPPLAKQNGVIPMTESTKLNLVMLRMTQMEEKANPLSDWTPFLKKYTEKAEEILGNGAEEVQLPGAGGSEVGAGSNDTGGAASAATSSPFEMKAVTSSSSENKSSFSGFSFGSKTTTATTDSSSSTAAATESKPFTGFSFAPKPKTSIPPVFATAKPTATSPTATATTTTTTTPTDDITNNSDNKTEEVVKHIDEDEEQVFECTAKYRKLVGEEWKSYASGKLRLSKSKKDADANAKMVVRDMAVGKVQLNIGIYKGMKFAKPVKKKGRGNIRFFAVQDADAGPEQFILVVKEDNADELYSKLTQLAQP